VLIGVVVWGAMAYVAVAWARREGLRFYDLYVARYGGHPTREQLDTERSQNPWSIYFRPLRRDRFHVVQVYMPVADPHVERARRRTEVAMNATWGVVIVFMPIIDVVYAMSTGNSLPAGWLFWTLARTISLVVLASSWIQLLVASAKGPSLRWWRVACWLGIASGVVGFFLFSVIAQS
jgi:hypothetical protein